MQIVIDISEKRYKDILRIAEVQLELKHFQTAEQIIANGTLLEQEPFINKPCVSSGVCEHDKLKVLEKIRAEIERQERWLMDTGYNACSVDIAFDAIKSVIAESKPQESEG